MSNVKITVPATTANVGPGFDSMGLALDRYLTLDIKQAEEWSVNHCSPNLPIIANVYDHLIYQVAKKTAEKFNQKLQPHSIDVKSDIPLTRGLGSSAAAVLAGIELANQVCELSLTNEQKLKYGTEFEGHSDNIAPALLGGLVLTADSNGDGLHYVQATDLKLATVLFIPNIELKTKDSRTVLPTMFTHENATKANGISNVMVAALLTGDYITAGKMMEQDLLHEPYRAKLIPNYEQIKQQSKDLGAYGTVISGAGPTMISFVPSEKAEEIITKMKANLPDNYEVVGQSIDSKGLQVNHK